MRTPLHATKICQATAAGYECTIKCDVGYFLYDDLSQTARTFSCDGVDEQFVPDTDVKCVSLGELKYIITVVDFLLVQKKILLNINTE